MNPDIKRELQEAMDGLLRQRRLKAEAREALTRRVWAEYVDRYGYDDAKVNDGIVKAVVDARMSKEWDTAGRTGDYVWAREDVVAWGTLAVVELLTDLRRDLAQERAARRRNY